MDSNITLYKVTLDRPVFNKKEDAFVSQININDRGGQLLLSPSMRFLDVIDMGNILLVEAEFLPGGSGLYRLVHDLDEQVRDEILRNGEDLLGKKFNPNSVENLFRRTLSVPDDIPALPKMCFIVKKRGNGLMCKVRERGRGSADIFNLKQGNEVEIKFTIDGVHFFKNRWCIMYVANEIKVVNYQCQTLKCLIDDEVVSDDSDQDSDD